MPESVSPGCTTYCVADPGDAVGVGEGDATGEGDVPPLSVAVGGVGVASELVAVGTGVLTAADPLAPSSGREGGRKSNQNAMTLPTKRASIVPRKTAGDGKRLAGSKQAAQKGPVPCCSQ